MSKKQKRVTFWGILWSFILVYIIAGVLTHGSTVIENLHNFPNDTFMDFYNSIQNENHPYENSSIYPPLANLIYYFLGSFIPREQFYLGSSVVCETQMGRLVMGMYISLTVVLFTYAVLKMYHGKIEEKILTIFTLLITGPFIFQLERGNLIFLALCFILFYVYGYKSEKAYVRHLAYISLAISASLKIYPAVLGLLLVRDKRWKDAIICVIYGVVLFFLPFVFLGGVKNISVLFYNIFNCSSEMETLGYGWKVGIVNTFDWIGILLNKYTIFDAVGNKLSILSVIMGIFLMLFGKYKQNWKVVSIPCLLMITYPPFSFVYSLIFISVPLILFLNDEEKNKMDWFYMVLFILILAPVTIVNVPSFEKLNGYYRFTLSTAIESVAVLVFQVSIYVEGVYFTVKQRSIKIG